MEMSGAGMSTAGTDAAGTIALEGQSGEAAFTPLGAGDSSSCVVNERCDGSDNDCDGQTDEGFTGLGEMCSVGLGACVSQGELSCNSEGSDLLCDALVISPSAEVCNEVDDDCDGVIDEEVAGCCNVGETRPCGVNVGVCTSGAQTCSPDGWSQCDGTGPSAETCDGADNDCDQLVDEGVLNACGSCGAVPTEVCDGSDNDCDGRTDEGVTNACGQCGRVPDEVCDRADNDCDGRVDEGVMNACGACGALPAEACDGADNDCDGRTDERLSNGACTVGRGACQRTGDEVCVRGGYECDASPGSPRDEVCDSVDNDCDGSIDERPSGGGTICTESCNGVDDDADGSVDEGVTNACGQCGALPNETCNGADDDCDGRTDEGVTNACGACGAVPSEQCNGADDDCDGAVDEGVLNACGECGAPPRERCDGADNDCDGRSDEGLDVGSPCLAGQGACQRSGVFFCGPRGGVLCSAQPGTGEDETCDQEDNDCDGSIDEDFDLSSDQLNCGSCGSYCVLQGVCEAGTCLCNGGPPCEPGYICNPNLGTCQPFTFP